MLPCKHRFHQECIDEWCLGGHQQRLRGADDLSTCPLCKAVVLQLVDGVPPRAAPAAAAVAADSSRSDGATLTRPLATTLVPASAPAPPDDAAVEPTSTPVPVASLPPAEPGPPSARVVVSGSTVALSGRHPAPPTSPGAVRGRELAPRTASYACTSREGIFPQGF